MKLQPLAGVFAAILSLLCAACGTPAQNSASLPVWQLTPADAPETGFLNRFRVVGVAIVPAADLAVGLQSPLHRNLDFSTPFTGSATSEPGAFHLELPPSDPATATLLLLETSIDCSSDPATLFQLAADSSLLLKIYVNGELVLTNDFPASSTRRHSRTSSTFRLVPSSPPGNLISIILLLPPSGSETLSLLLTPADPSRYFHLSAPSN